MGAAARKRVEPRYVGARSSFYSCPARRALQAAETECAKLHEAAKGQLVVVNYAKQAISERDVLAARGKAMKEALAWIISHPFAHPSNMIAVARAELEKQPKDTMSLTEALAVVACDYEATNAPTGVMTKNHQAGTSTT
jgi:hypothetical protein